MISGSSVQPATKTSTIAAATNELAKAGDVAGFENDVSRRKAMVGSLSKSRSRAEGQETVFDGLRSERCRWDQRLSDGNVKSARQGESGGALDRRQRAALLLSQALADDSTPDTTVVSGESACGGKRTTISSELAGEKHMTISTISVILWKFRRRTISPAATFLPVAGFRLAFAVLRFCGYCGSGKPRRRECWQKPFGFIWPIACLLYVCRFEPRWFRAELAYSPSGQFQRRRLLSTSESTVQGSRHVPIRCTASPS